MENLLLRARSKINGCAKLKRHGVVEKWNIDPSWRASVSIAYFCIIVWIIVRKRKRYVFGLGQGILGLSE
jgi:hypothetical protein